MVDMQRELARENAELRELHELKNRFLGMAAHDLRLPLSAIVLYTDFMLDHTTESLSEQQLEYLKVVRDSGRFMVNLIESLLDVAVIESGSVYLDRQPGDLAGMADRLVTRMNPMASSRGISLAYESEGSIEFQFDHSKVEQILDNLLGNALKYCSSGCRCSCVPLSAQGMPLPRLWTMARVSFCTSRPGSSPFLAGDRPKASTARRQ